jgi:hypothetical protein
MTPKSLNFLVNKVILRHPLLYNGLLIHVSETTHSSTEVVEPLEAVISIRFSLSYEGRSHQTRTQQFARQRIRSQTYLQRRAASVKYTIETIWIQRIIDAPPALTNAMERQGNGNVIHSERRGMCTYNHSPRSRASL